MKKLTASLLFLGALANPFFAQDIGYNVSVGLRKTFNFSKKSSLDLREQIQLTPEVKKYRNKYGDFFNEEGFWPIPDRYRDDDELDDDDEEDFPTGAGNGIQDNDSELNDAPTRIEWDWRNNTSLQYNYRFFPWLRANAGYGLQFDGEEFRHSFRTELAYRPLKHGKRKRKIDLAARALFQRIGQPDDGQYEWASFLVPRLDVEWAFKKNHLLVVSPAFNGAWDDARLEWDRWRVNAGLTFIYQKMHRFTFSYQFQQRLDKPKRSHGLGLAYEVRF
jgi:hypothetical protein